MKRRDLIKHASALAVAATAMNATAASAAPAGLTAALAGCLESGETCLAHCHTLLGKGDPSLAGCAKTVSDMLAVDAALLRLASTDSKYLADAAKLVVAVSRDCEAECRKHADKHPVCKACAESCARVIAEAGKAA